MTRAYLGAACLTLVLASALPALACFTVACGVHMDLLLRHAQLTLARDADAYASPLGSAATNVRLQQLSSYHVFFHGTAHGTGARMVTCESEGSGHSDRHLLHESVHALPYYSPRSIEMRELLHDAAADGTWQWVQCHDGTAQLQWGLVDGDGPGEHGRHCRARDAQTRRHADRPAPDARAARVVIDVTPASSESCESSRPARGRPRGVAARGSR